MSFGGGKSTFERIIAIMTLIPSGKPGITTSDIQAGLMDMGVSMTLRTIYRDIEKIKEMNTGLDLVIDSHTHKHGRCFYYSNLPNPYVNEDVANRSGYSFAEIVSIIKSSRHTGVDYMAGIGGHYLSVEEEEISRLDEMQFRVEFSRKVKKIILHEAHFFDIDYHVEKYDDRLFLIFKSVPSESMYRWLSSLGSNIVIHEPFILRERIGNEINKVAKNYSTEFDGLGGD